MNARLKGTLELAVEYHGRLYPSWMERGSSRVWCLAGSVGFGAQIIIHHDWRARDRRNAANLKTRLRKAGYRLIKTKARPCLRADRLTPRRPTRSNSSTAPGSPRSN